MLYTDLLRLQDCVLRDFRRLIARSSCAPGSSDRTVSFLPQLRWGRELIVGTPWRVYALSSTLLLYQGSYFMQLHMMVFYNNLATWVHVHVFLEWLTRDWRVSNLAVTDKLE